MMSHNKRYHTRLEKLYGLMGQAIAAGKPVFSASRRELSDILKVSRSVMYYYAPGLARCVSADYGKTPRFAQNRDERHAERLEQLIAWEFALEGIGRTVYSTTEEERIAFCPAYEAKVLFSEDSRLLYELGLLPTRRSARIQDYVNRIRELILSNDINSVFSLERTELTRLIGTTTQIFNPYLDDVVAKLSAKYRRKPLFAVKQVGGWSSEKRQIVANNLIHEIEGLIAGNDAESVFSLTRCELADILDVPRSALNRLRTNIHDYFTDKYSKVPRFARTRVENGEIVANQYNALSNLCSGDYLPLTPSAQEISFHTGIQRSLVKYWCRRQALPLAKGRHNLQTWLAWRRILGLESKLAPQGQHVFFLPEKALERRIGKSYHIVRRRINELVAGKHLLSKYEAALDYVQKRLSRRTSVEDALQELSAQKGKLRSGTIRLARLRLGELVTSGGGVSAEARTLREIINSTP